MVPTRDAIAEERVRARAGPRWGFGGIRRRGSGTGADPYFDATTVATIKKSRSLGLDAGEFLPISRDEIIDAAKGQNLFTNPWFGRRDRIPPADDPRTKLIDRAMVTHGLITPEHLVEIHGVGDEMERAVPSLEGMAHQAALAGEAAVEADQEARAG